jgi:putative SOS response-associated peptidase YedK
MSRLRGAVFEEATCSTHSIEQRDINCAGSTSTRNAYAMEPMPPISSVFRCTRLLARLDNTTNKTATLTTTANDLVRLIHDRMPAILPVDAQALRMDAGVKDWKWPADVLLPFPAPGDGGSPGRYGVGNVRHDGPDRIEPLVSTRLLF